MAAALKQVSLRVLLEIWLWRHGALWPLAAALLLTAAALELFVHEQLQKRLSATSHELQAVERESRNAPKTVIQPREDVRAKLAASASAEASIARMIELAQAQGIVLAQADYQSRQLPAGAISQLQIMQPVRATYPQLRKYVEAVLRELPNASLESISARREGVGQPQLEAKLSWSVWSVAATAPSADVKERPRP